MSDILILQALFFICGTTVFVSSLRFLRRYLELKHERTLSAPSDQVQQRLERIESGIDAMAIEVERIAEGNRFVAKLLAERAGPSVPRSPERVITPH